MTIWTSPEHQPVPTGRKRRNVWARLAALGAMFAVLTAVGVAPAPTASATVVDNPVVGSTQCLANGTYSTDWILTNTSGAVLSIGSYGFSGPYQFPQGITPNPVPIGGTALLHTDHTPGESTTPLGVTIGWHWLDNQAVMHSGTSTASVPVDGLCASFFHPLSPQRILDSRPATQVGVYHTPWAGGTTRDVAVGGLANVPSDAVAVVLNVTVTDTTAPSFLSIWPAGAAQPTVSSLNWSAGRTIPNAVTVKLGTDGKVLVFNHSGAVNVIIDVAGYYAKGPGDGFTSWPSVWPPPAERILDSRPATQVGTYNTPWAAVTTRDVAVGGLAGVPANADAVVLNVTATDTTLPSFLTVWPTGQPRPNASSLNWTPGVTIPNAVTVKLGTDGKISMFNLSGAVDVVADVSGYYLAGTGKAFHPINPLRLLDSRPATQVGPYSSPWTAGMSRDLVVPDVTNPDAVPGDAQGVVLNVTATDTTGASFLTVWAAGFSRPTASSLNWTAGLTIPNAVTTGLGVSGAISLFNNSGNVNVVVDASGWFG